jgi:hypothetical protein
MTFGTEMFGDFCKNVEHANLSSREWFAGGESLFHDEERAKKLAEQSKKTEKSKYEEK